jgi:hypothetical protein
MKKIISTLVFTAVFSAFTFAQEVPTTINSAAEEVKTEQIKVDKKAAKLKQEAEQTEAYKAASLTPEEVEKANEILVLANKKMYDIKKNESASAEEKEAAKKAITKDKTEALKKLMGDDKYKLYNDVRKKQKEAAKESKGE